MSELGEQSRIILALGGTLHIRVFRNNVGVAKFSNGSVVKYGLATGSADLIGWKSVIITPDMIGSTVAIFLSVECKAPKGKLTDKQTAWLEAVRKAGGIAIVARSVGDISHLL
jgi:VRR-NUC domain